MCQREPIFVVIITLLLVSFKQNGYNRLNFKYNGVNGMAIENTLSIIKPDAVKKNVVGKIITRFEEIGLKVVAAKMLQLKRDQAEAFYAVHKDRSFFSALVNFMIQGPILVQVLRGENAIQKNRDMMGATNPADAKPGTIRADFADSIEANAVHGSDAPETAKEEITFFFKADEICG